MMTMKKQIGFIGCGKIAQAMIGGMIRSKTVKPSSIIASATTKETRVKVSDQFGIEVTGDNTKVAAEANLLFLGTVPGLHRQILEEICR